MNSKVKTLTQVALMAAVLCVLGPLSIPIGPVPISLTPFAVILTVYILGPKKGTLSVLVYLLIGLIGVPVFSGFSGGAGKLFGPTGGYLIGFIPMALIAGYFIEKFYKNVVIQFLGCLIGLFILYVLGTLWLAFSASMSLQAALAAGVLPFIGIDIAKIIAAMALGRAVRAGLSRTNFYRSAGVPEK